MAHAGRPRKSDARADQIRQAVDYSDEDEAIGFIGDAGVDILDGEARTPLMHAAFKGKGKIVSWLVANGANINHQDRNGWSALHFAVQGKNLEVSEYLLQHGASVDLRDAYGNTALWRAAFDARGSYGLVRLLLAHKADPHAKNNSHRSALDFAVQSGNDALIAVLKNG